jgi:glutamate 5-kinase
VGVGKLHLPQRPADTPSKQAAAAIGQCELMYLYDKLFGEYNHVVSQVLLTRDILEEEKRKRNVVTTFQKLLEYGSIPIVNENDTTAVEELEFGDNDTLSAIVAVLCGADALIILSDMMGSMTATRGRIRPQNRSAKCIMWMTGFWLWPEEVCSSRGTGGLITKVHAAQIACGAGIHMVIMNGSDPSDLYKVFDGETLGTHFFPESK